MNFLAKEIRRLRALAELNPNRYKHKYETLRRILAAQTKKVFYGK